MKIYYEESDLVSFGEFLLSKERTDKVKESTPPGLPYEDTLFILYQADLDNWKEKQKNENSL